MVENAIRNAEEYPSKRQLWLSLRKKMMYQTLNVILEYLEESGKIMIIRRKIFWTWSPKMSEKLRKNPHLIIR